MSGDDAVAVPATADEVRSRNADVDRRVLELADSVTAEELAVDPGTGEWVLAQNLAHLGEFPHFFAADIRRFLAGDAGAIGRTHDHPVRNDAVDHLEGRALDDLRASCREAFTDLADALEGLRDEHLSAPTNNVRYGEEPLTAFLDRYVLGHKAAHLRQLEETLAAVQASGS